MRSFIPGIVTFFVLVTATLYVVVAFLPPRQWHLQHACSRSGGQHHNYSLYLFGKKKGPRNLPDLNKSSDSTGTGKNTRSSSCAVCSGKGAIDCKVCAGTGKDKVNGNVFERWTCTTCKGFGLVVCPKCSSTNTGVFKAGLTPEQRGER